MRGLLYKDFAVIKKELLLSGVAILLFSIPLFLPWTAIREANGGATDAESIGIMVFGVFPFFVYIFIFGIIDAVQNGIYAHDERKVWSAFVMASPLRANAQVLSKYYLSLLLAFSVYIWGFVCDYISMLVTGVGGSASGIYTLFFWIHIIMRALEIPFLIRFGQSHGRICKILIMAVLVFIGIVYLLFGYIPENLSLDACFEFIFCLTSNQEMFSTAALGVVALLPYVAIALYYLSYKVSCKWYEKGVEAYEA